MLALQSPTRLSSLLHRVVQRQFSSQHSGAGRSRALQASGGSQTGGRRSPSLSDREDMQLDGSHGGGGGEYGQDSTPLAVKDRRRELHTQAEQKRRDAIKQGYDKLYELVGAAPGASAGSVGSGGGGGESGAKSLSKASILQRSIRHMEHLAKQKEIQERELDKLHKEVMALKIMKMNYEHFVTSAGAAGSAAAAAAGAATSPQLQPLPEQVKLSVFQSVMDQLFVSFDRSTSAGSFAELSGCVIAWLEEQCRPQAVHELSVQALQQVLTHYSQQHQARPPPGQNRL